MYIRILQFIKENLESIQFVVCSKMNIYEGLHVDYFEKENISILR